MTFRRVLAVLILVLALPSRATEYTDLWWNPAESGWGLTVTHQGNVVFLTLFVFGADGKALWFSSPAFLSQSDANGNPIYTGTLFQNAGPYFGAAFNPASVVATPVGSATFAVTGVTTANLVYTVNGVAVGKALTRQTFRGNEDVVGNYIGGLVTESFSCPFPIVNNGNGFESLNKMSITGPDTDMQIALGDGLGCTTQGNYTQAGRMGRVDGNVACVTNVGGVAGLEGTGSFFEIEADRVGITARYVVNYRTGCTERGRFAGARRVGSP